MANIIISDLKKINSNSSNNVSFLSDMSVDDIKDIKGGFLEPLISFGLGVIAGFVGYDPK